jgi:hypothetical protein
MRQRLQKSLPKWLRGEGWEISKSILVFVSFIGGVYDQAELVL